MSQQGMIEVGGRSGRHYDLPTVSLTTPSGHEHRVISVVSMKLQSPQFAPLALSGKLDNGSFFDCKFFGPNFGRHHSFVAVPISGLDFSHCILCGGNFDGCRVSKLSLTHSICVDTSFDCAYWNAERIDLSGTVFVNCNFSGCDPKKLLQINFFGSFADKATRWPDGYKPEAKAYEMGITRPIMDGIKTVHRA